MLKEIEIIPLAKRKMNQRGIPEEWVRETLNMPEQVVEGYGGRQVAHRQYKIQGKVKLLRAVFEETPTNRIVITAYLTSDVKRYWKERRS